VERFCELFDQIGAYEVNPDMVHYTTRFIEGLSPSICLAILFQQPTDIDKAVELALLFEELEDDPQFSSAPSSPMYQCIAPACPQPSRIQMRPTTAKKVHEPARSTFADEKWAQLRNFRKSKGLCFICGARWGKDHQCKSIVQLHVVQEMMEFLQVEEP